MLFNSLDYILFLMLAVAGYWTLVRLNILRVVFIFFRATAVPLAECQVVTVSRFLYRVYLQ